VPARAFGTQRWEFWRTRLQASTNDEVPGAQAALRAFELAAA
jgi:hypothetical protein